MNELGPKRAAIARTGVPDDFQLDGFIPYMLNQIFDQMNGNLRQALRPFGLSIHQWRVLCLLKLRGDSSMGEISASTVMGQSTISRVVDQLERDGLAMRRPLPENNRVILVSLSAAGERMIEEVFPAAIAVHGDAIDQFSAAEKEMLLSMLHRMLANLRQHGALHAASGNITALG